jgi:hypothetical protein
MTPERWRLVERLFQEAIDCPAAERRAFLDRVCNGKDDLRREVESLLACDAPDQRLVEIPAALHARPSDDGHSEPDMTGRRIGPYRLIQWIGHGGMGAVYLSVRDDDQYEKQVAIKLLKRAGTRISC